MGKTVWLSGVGPKEREGEEVVARKVSMREAGRRRMWARMAEESLGGPV